MPFVPTSADFELMFESAPISLWLEDHSQLKALFDSWREAGVTDFKAHLKQHPERLAECSTRFHVLKVNQKTLEVFVAASQAELVGRLAEVFRYDMFDNIAVELQALWSGNLNFSNQSVNYALDGRRLDVQIHVRVLRGYEDTWERVLVSLEDISGKDAAQKALEASEQHARELFDHSPVSLWVESFVGVKALMDEARASGVEDLRVLISAHPGFVKRCMGAIKVLDVNQRTLSIFGATSKDELLGKLEQVFRGEMIASVAELLLVGLWNGNTQQMGEVVNYTLSGNAINIHLQFAVMAGFEGSWERVLVSMIDITERKKTEAKLEYMGTHDALMHLRNRAFYADELDRIARQGPWPVSVLAMDLNGLKRVNDSEGHAAGDDMLRCVGEVLAQATAESPYCVARIGGDEFVVLMPGCDEQLALKLKSRIESMLALYDQSGFGQALSLSIGVATC